MFKLTVKVRGCANNGFSHAEIKIQDMESKESYVVNFSKTGTPGTSKQKKIKLFDEEEELFYPPIILYSSIEKSLKNFRKDIENKFNCWTLCFQNCSDAADYTLNYFFPISKKARVLWQTYKCVTSPFCILTLGQIPFFATPPLTNGPTDIYLKARLLSRYYGNLPELPLLSLNSDMDSVPKQMLMG